MIFPKKLKKGSHVRVIAPSRSFKIISQECRDIAKKRFEELGLKVSYSKHADEFDALSSSSIKSRVADIHDAFKDPKVDAIFTAIGGFNSNQLLKYLDYDLIKKNPKILCGFSDITALTNAITAKTGLVTYSGPHFSTFGMIKGIEYTADYMKKCLFSDEPFEVEPTKEWSDDLWFMEQEKRKFVKNTNYWVLNKGDKKPIKGKIIGGNMCTFQLLFGTAYMPSIKNSILFIEDDEETNAVHFDRDLQSLIHQKDFDTVKAIFIGRFQKGSKIDAEALAQIVASKEELKKIPVIANFDIGHTTPIITFPIGGEAEVKVDKAVTVKIIKH